ncbi:hypothetical protein SDC9_142254 [bioreactor metagenome]|uniref:Uncharacterized protein n=1 Tax=bioreactor metagenome TaxID=1076179 RepID=A0A645E2Q6_9ZZZZ
MLRRIRENRWDLQHREVAVEHRDAGLCVATKLPDAVRHLFGQRNEKNAVERIQRLPNDRIVPVHIVNRADRHFVVDRRAFDQRQIHRVGDAGKSRGQKADVPARFAVLLGDPHSHVRLPGQQPPFDQGIDRLPNRHPGDAELVDQLALHRKLPADVISAQNALFQNIGGTQVFHRSISFLKSK